MSPLRLSQDYKTLLHRAVKAAKRGSVKTLRAVWCDDLTAFCAGLDENDKRHPLLHAVHRWRFRAVRFLVSVGLSPTLPGTVMPYTGDGMHKEMLMRVTPQDVVSGEPCGFWGALLKVIPSAFPP